MLLWFYDQTEYNNVAGIPSPNVTVVIGIDGFNMTSGTTKDNGREDLSVFHYVSGNSVDDFPTHVDIYAQHNAHPSVNASGKIMLVYRKIGSDGAVRQYKGDFSVAITIKK